MPFIDPEYLLNEKISTQRILITGADDSDVVSISFQVAKSLKQMKTSVLWIDGNLGERGKSESSDTTQKVLKGQLPATEILQEKEEISVLEEKADYFLGELPVQKQYQFLQDLKELYPNYDKVVIAVDGKNPELQKKWMEQAENIYLVFNAKNLLMNRTLAWLKENKNKTKGLIGLGKNNQEVLLAYMRLKNILGNIPELILDIKKIAP